MICVDTLRLMKDNNNPLKRKAIKMYCFMYVDNGNNDVLHIFARSIGLPVNWFRDDCFLPRYILDEIQRQEAINKGVYDMTFKHMIEIRRVNMEVQLFEIRSNFEKNVHRKKRRL